MHKGKTFLFVGLDISNKVEINQHNIPSVGECVNITKMPFIKDGEYRVIARDTVSYMGVLYPRILAEYVGGIKNYLYTLDFSDVILKQG